MKIPYVYVRRFNKGMGKKIKYIQRITKNLVIICFNIHNLNILYFNFNIDFDTQDDQLLWCCIIDYDLWVCQD